MRLFDFFTRKNKSESTKPVDLSVLVTELHSHFIPGIDDGAKDMADALDLVSSIADFGYKKIITTPHIISDSYRNTPEIILSGLDKLKGAALEKGLTIELNAAAEYYLDADFQLKVEEKKLLTFGSNYVLFEISYLYPPDSIDDVVFALQLAGYIPVLAHPERYNFWHGNFERYELLKAKGVLFQMNVNSLTGHYSPQTKKVAEVMIDKRMIDFLGSDCHHMGHINLMDQARHLKYLHKLVDSGDLQNHTL